MADECPSCAELESDLRMVRSTARALKDVIDDCGLHRKPKQVARPGDPTWFPPSFPSEEP